jgi:hypothetical protein
MRAAFKKSLALAVVALGVCAGSAQAETHEVIVKVPFAFAVQGHSLPAGKYVVSRVSDDPSALIIRGEDVNKKSIAIFLTMPADGHDPAGDTPALTFSRFENGYRLSTVWESASEGQQMLPRKG